MNVQLNLTRKYCSDRLRRFRTGTLLIISFITGTIMFIILIYLDWYVSTIELVNKECTRWSKKRSHYNTACSFVKSRPILMQIHILLDELRETY